MRSFVQFSLGVAGFSILGVDALPLADAGASTEADAARLVVPALLGSVHFH